MNYYFNGSYTTDDDAPINCRRSSRMRFRINCRHRMCVRMRGVCRARIDSRDRSRVRSRWCSTLRKRCRCRACVRFGSCIDSRNGNLARIG